MADIVGSLFGISSQELMKKWDKVSNPEGMQEIKV